VKARQFDNHAERLVRTEGDQDEEQNAHHESGLRGAGGSGGQYKKN